MWRNSVIASSWSSRWLCVLVRDGGPAEVHFRCKVRETQGNVQLVDDSGIPPDVFGVGSDLMTLRFEKAKDGDVHKPQSLRFQRPSSQPQ